MDGCARSDQILVNSRVFGTAVLGGTPNNVGLSDAPKLTLNTSTDCDLDTIAHFSYPLKTSKNDGQTQLFTMCL